jgi:Pyruvate/2-oxoacid:ferredoxin oxidoreductase gamma subunit
LRGHSISELILSPRAIDYTGIKQPDVVLALAQEGVDRRKDMFAQLDNDALVLQADGVEVPVGKARIHSMDLKSRKIKKPDWALASLAVMAGFNEIVSVEMLAAALKIKFKGKTLDAALELIRQVRE